MPHFESKEHKVKGRNLNNPEPIVNRYGQKQGSSHRENIIQTIETRALTLEEVKRLELAIASEELYYKEFGHYYNETDSIDEGKWVFRSLWP